MRKSGRSRIPRIKRKEDKEDFDSPKRKTTGTRRDLGERREGVIAKKRFHFLPFRRKDSAVSACSVVRSRNLPCPN
jgi:hypothetical protein